MLLCIDIGNTRVKGAYFDGKEFTGKFGLLTVKDPLHFNIDQFESELSQKKVDGVIFVSVVPLLNDVITRSIISKTGKHPIQVSSDMHLNFEIHYDDPSKLGADRIATASAAFQLYPGTDMIVVDIGTAITFCVLLSEGVFDGGVIAPGYSTAVEALSLRASQLFTVHVSRPERISAHNTQHALQSGFYYGWVSLVQGIVERLRKEYSRDFKLILTGGGAETLAEDIPHFSYDKDLLLKGLVRLYHLNS